MAKIVPWEKGVRHSGQMNFIVMAQNLLSLKEIMDKHRITFVFIFGGLLGLIRENRLLPWDNDVEFACFFDDHRKMKPIVEEMKAKGFYVPDRNECPLHDHFFIRGGEKIELWWFVKIDNEWVYDNSIRYPVKFFDTLEEIEFLDKKWKIPSNPKEFLKITYGKTWIVPNPKGSYILGKNKK